MTLKNLLLSICLFLVGESLAWGAVVILKDGTQVRGTVVSATARDVQIQTEEGTRTLPADSIRTIDYAGDGQAAPATPPAPASTAAPAPSEPAPYPYHYGHYGRRRYRREEPPASLENLNDSFSFDFGFASPLSRVSPDATGGSAVQNGGTGARFGVQFLHALGPRLEAGVDVGFLDRGGMDEDGLVPSAHAEISGDTFMPLAVLKYSFAPRGRFARPYVLAGLGADHTSTTIDARPDFGFVWADSGTDETRRLVNGSNWGWASKLALGMEFRGWDPFMGAFELGWVQTTNPSLQATPDGRALGLNRVTGKLSELLFTVRWGWRY